MTPASVVEHWARTAERGAVPPVRVILMWARCSPKRFTLFLLAVALWWLLLATIPIMLFIGLILLWQGLLLQSPAGFGFAAGMLGVVFLLHEAVKNELPSRISRLSWWAAIRRSMLPDVLGCRP